MIKKLQFKEIINAPVEKVWDIMLSDETYRQWTEAFHAGSYFEGDWSEGSNIKFLAVDDGKLGGMFSKIAKNDKYKFISIEHLGLISEGVVDTESDFAKKFAGAFENYTFNKVDDNTTELLVEVDAEEGEFATMFEGMWPKALEKLKSMCEN